MSMNFKFGIELEFADLSTDAVMRVLSDAGIRIVDRGYTHADYSDGVWKVVPDASVRDGLEVVSPVLFGKEGLAECVKVAHALEAAEASINRTCGFHVHIDASSFSAIELYRIYDRYKKFESEIDSFMPRSRRGNSNQYCRSLASGSIPDPTRGMTKESLAGAQMSRYYKVNLKSYLRHHTVEFRQHSGTVDAAKISNWIRFLQEFCEVSRHPVAASGAKLQKRQTEILDFIRSSASGVTTQDLCREFGLLPHSARSALTYIRRKGVTIIATKAYGVMRYSVGDLMTAGDDLFRGIDADVHQFYLARRAVLAA